MASPASSGRGGQPTTVSGSGLRLAGLGLIGFAAGSSLGWLWGLLQRPTQPLGETVIPMDVPDVPAVPKAGPLDQPAEVTEAVTGEVTEAVAESDAVQGVRQAAVLAKAKLTASLSRLPANSPAPDGTGNAVDNNATADGGA